MKQYNSIYLLAFKIMLESDVKILNTYISSDADFLDKEKYLESLRDAKLEMIDFLSDLKPEDSKIPSTSSKMIYSGYTLENLEDGLKSGDLYNIVIPIEKNQYEMIKNVSSSNGFPGSEKSRFNKILRIYEKIISQSKRNKTVSTTFEILT